MLFFLKTLFSRGLENCSETFSGSANDPPLPLPPTCMSLELWILPWGMRELTSSFPGAASPTWPWLRSHKLQQVPEEERPY